MNGNVSENPESSVIAVVGGTGMLGQPVARSLKRAGYGVRIVTRDAAAASGMFGDDYGIVQADVMDPASLVAALEGCHGVHINLSGEAEQTGTENTVAAAGKAGVKRITYISGSTVDERNSWFPMIRRKLAAERAVRESGMQYTIFRPTWFMESLALYVRDGRAYAFGSQKTPYYFMAADDYARMVAQAYLSDDAVGLTVSLRGPEPILFHDALMRYCRVHHPEIKKISTMPYWLARVVSVLTGNRRIGYISDLMAYFEKVGDYPVEEPSGILGTPATTLDMWLASSQEG